MVADDIIPANWAVMVCPLAIHLNPDMYEDPLVFNPSRWEVSSSISSTLSYL